MKEISNKLLNEKYFIHTLDNGLKVILYPKPEFKRSFAMLTVKYGSLNQEFIINDQLIQTPKGVAHFLEHKMFEMPNDVDASTIFAELGAEIKNQISHRKRALDKFTNY